MAKYAAKKRVAEMFRFAVLSAFISGSLMILLGSGLNNLNHKYSHVSAAGVRSCKRELFIRNVPDSRLCCDTSHNSLDWICIASYDKLNKIFSSKWAFQIPLIPVVITLITECTKPTSYRLQSHSSRLIFYFCLTLFRTYFLYIAVNYVENGLQGHLKNNTNCWYIDLVKGKSCKDAFDFSDHIVLHMAQYMLPSAIELAYVYLQCTRTDIKAASVYKYLPTMISAVTIIAISLRGILLTGMFFHTGAENVTAGLVVFIFVVVPLLKYSNSSFFVKALLPMDASHTVH